MSPTRSRITVQQRLALDFITLKHACPKGIYVAPVPEQPLLWTSVLFVKKGPYARAVLRFEVAFTADYPAKPPIITFLTDIFHPLVAPLTTYTYSSKDRGVETVSAADDEKLPPGGLTLRHGFPEWYGSHLSDNKLVSEDNTASNQQGDVPRVSVNYGPTVVNPPHIIEVLQYMKVIFEADALIDDVPLESAANPGAWHAWRSFRARVLNTQTASPTGKSLDVSADAVRDRSMSPSKQQPGGARRPGEWNWTGVWEDRVRKAVQSSISDTTLFGGEESKVIDFVQLSNEQYCSLAPVVEARSIIPNAIDEAAQTAMATTAQV